MADNDDSALRDRLYTTMSQEADGLYKLLITICTTFLGGTLVFFEKLFVSDARWSIWLLFLAWLALTYSIAVLVWIRWQNVEAHRHALEYTKTGDENEYKKAEGIPEAGRRWTLSAIIIMIAGLLLLALFTAINVFYRYFGG